MKRKHKTPIVASAAAGNNKAAKKPKSASTSSAASSSSDGFSRMLGGDQVVTALLSSWEESEPCYVEKNLTKFPPNLPKGKDLVALIDQEKLALGRDIILTTGDADLEFGTPHGLATRKQAEEYFANGWSLNWFNADRYSRPVRELLQSFDQFWQGEGGVDSMIQTVPADAVPFPPALHSGDLLLIQTEGSQHVTLYDVDDEEVSSGTLCTDMGLHFCTTLPHILDPQYDIEPVFAAEMNPGDFLFIPQHLAVFVHTQDMPSQSGAIWLYVPNQIAWDDVMDAAMAAAREQMGIQTGMKFFPRRAEGQNGLAVLTKSVDDSRNVMSEMLHDMLGVAGESLSTALGHMARARGSYTRRDFEAPASLQSLDIAKLVEDNGGLVKIPNLLPADLAERMYQTLDAISPEEWTLTEDNSGTTQYAVSVPHAFMSTRRFPNSHAVLDLFRTLLPTQAATFSAGMYSTGEHFIDSHDDRAYKEVAGQVYSRDIAFIYYLTKDWTEEDGGALVDNEAEGGEKVLVPEFNSAVAFKVPRFHTVMPPTGDRPRYTIFGWFLAPGKLYDMDYEANGGSADPAKPAHTHTETQGAKHTHKHTRPAKMKAGVKRAAAVEEEEEEEEDVLVQHSAQPKKKPVKARKTHKSRTSNSGGFVVESL